MLVKTYRYLEAIIRVPFILLYRDLKKSPFNPLTTASLRPLIKGVRGIYIFLLGIIFFIGCATVPVQIQVRREAKFDVSGIKRIAIVDFKDYPDHPGSGGKTAGRLISQLLKQEHYEIMERDQIAKILEEHKFAVTGIIDPTTATEVGKMLGVDALLFGDVSAYTTETTRGEENVSEKVGTGQYEEVERTNIFTGKKYKVKEEIMKTVLVRRPFTVKKGTVGINLRMVNVTTGLIIGADSHTESYNQKAITSTQLTALPSDEAVLNELTNQVVDEFVALISPHYETELRVLEKGKDKLTRLGVTYAEQGLWDEATVQWDDAVKVNPSNTAAVYNLGIVAERTGNFTEAKNRYETALRIQPENKMYMQALRKIKEIITQDKVKEHNKE